MSQVLATPDGNLLVIVTSVAGDSVIPVTLENGAKMIVMSESTLALTEAKQPGLFTDGFMRVDGSRARALLKQARKGLKRMERARVALEQAERASDPPSAPDGGSSEGTPE